MLRNVQEVTELPTGKFQIRLKCGHLLSHKFTIKPSIDGTYQCPLCDIKGQGVRSIVGHLDNGFRKNRSRPSK